MQGNCAERNSQRAGDSRQLTEKYLATEQKLLPAASC